MDNQIKNNIYRRNILLNLSLLGCLVGMSQEVKIYPYYVAPKEYSDYSRRSFKTPTWETFSDTVQFVGGRRWGKHWGKIDGNAPYWLQDATVMRPNFTHFLMDKHTLKGALTKMKEQGLFLFNINAYGPGTPIRGGFGQFHVPAWKTQMMESILGDKYMGFDLGEQDGRYWADCRSIDFPMSANYQQRYLKAMDYMHRAAKDQGNIISLLSVKWFWHYPIKDGFIKISGAESQNKTYTSNDQIHYAYLRGASKQYGTLWYGDISVFNSWGWKVYLNNVKSEKAKPHKGNSLAWMQRMLLSQYQYNSTILGFEGSKFHADNSLSPIGKMQKDMQEFVKKHPKPGPQHTPIAFLQDFFSGWMTPGEPFSDKHKVWNFLPYKTGDWFTHNMFDLCYKGYSQAGTNKNEYGGLANTPYGDVVDVLLSDVNLAILSQYQIVVLTNEINYLVPELSDKLKTYVSNGGHLVITTDNAQKLIPELNISESRTNTIKTIQNNKGQIMLIDYDNMGLNANNQLKESVRKELDQLFKTTRLFSVGDSLGYITNIEGDGKYMVGVYNHSLEYKKFKIECHVGTINDIQELEPIRDLSKEKGYYPEGYEDISREHSDDNWIAPGDSRLFMVDISEENITVLSEGIQPERVVDNYLWFDQLIGLKEKLQLMPTFFDYFSGMNLSYRSLKEIDLLKLKEDAWWYNLKQLQVSIDFNPSDIEQIKGNRILLKDIKEKLACFNHFEFSTIYPNANENQVQFLKKEFNSKNVYGWHSNNILTYSYGKINFKERKDKPVIVINKLTEWSEIYPIAKALVSLEKIDTPRRIKDSSFTNWNKKTNIKNKHLFLANHDNNKNLLDYCSHADTLTIKKFGGIKINGTYLYSRSKKYLASIGEELKKHDYTIIIDLCPEINNYPNLTWVSELGHHYNRTVKILDNILDKMQLLGAKHVIIGSHMRPEAWQDKFGRTREESILAGMTDFINRANAKGITVSIQNRMHKHYPGRLLAKPDEVKVIVNDLRMKGNDVKYAAHFGFGESEKELLEGTDDILQFCIIASEGSPLYDYRVPYSIKNKRFDHELNSNVFIVFDADYKSTKEMLNDRCYFK